MSGYLRDIQLRKQLEQKVKEATKNRKEAEKEFAAASEMLEACKGIDASTTDIEKLLAEATTSMSSKDYRLALEKSIEAKEKAKKSYASRASAIVESSANLLILAKNMGANVGEGDVSITKAREALSKEDYDAAIDLAHKSWKKFEKVVHEHLSKSFSSAQSLIMTAKNLGKDTGPVEDLLSRARGAVESNDFELALSYTNECMETIQSELIEEVAKATSDVEMLMKTSKDMGADTSKINSLIDRSKADAEKLEFQKALNALKQAKAEGEKSLQKGLESHYTDLQKFIESARQMGADISKGKGFVEKMSAALEAGNFQQASEVGKKAVEELQAAQFQRVLFTIAQSRDKFIAAKNIGADITPSMEFLNRARAALQKGDFNQALELAQQAENEVERSLKDFKEVEQLVKDMSRDFMEAETLGVNVSTARRILERAKKDITARDFKSATEQVRKAREELIRNEYERTMEVMEHSELVMTLGERMNADLEEAGKLLEECIVCTKEKQYRKAIELAQKASNSAETGIKNQLMDSLAIIRGSMGFLAEDAANVRSLVDKAEGALAANDYDGAYNFVMEAQKLVEGKTKTKADNFHVMLKHAVELGAELGMPIGTLSGLYKEVDEAKARSNYSAIINKIEESATDVSTIGESIFNAVKERLVEARNLRINIDELLQTLKRARMALSVADFKEAFRLMAECNENTSNLIAIHKETYNAISSAAALVAEAKKKDVDVTSVLEMLLEAKKAFERLDYERALELSKKAKSETEKLMVLYSSAQNIIAAKDRIDVASRLGVDVTALKDNLELAKDAMKRKVYDDALMLSTKTQASLDELLENKISSLLSQSDSILETLKDISLGEQREKVTRAKEMLEKREWNEAAEVALAARSDLERLVKKREESTVAIKKCQDMISEVEALNIEAPGAEKLLEKADKLAKSGNFDDAIENANKGLLEAEKERDININKTIDKFQEAIAKAKRDGIDTRSAEKLLDKARLQFKEKKYRQALALAMQSEAESERIGLQQDMAAKAIMTAEKKLKGYGSPMPDVSNMIVGAQRAFEEGDYVKSLDLAIRAGDSFNKYRELLEETKEIRVKAEKITKTAYDIGADSKKLDKIFEEAQSAFDAGNPKAARDAFQQCVEWGLGLCQSHLENLKAQTAEFISALKTLDLDPTQIQKKMTEAQAHLETENFEVAYKLIEGAKNEAQSIMALKVAEAMVTSEEAISHAKKLNADVSEAEKLLEEGRRSLEAGKFERAIQLIRDSVSKVESRREFEKKFIDFSFKADSMIRNARKFGIDVSKGEEILTEALKLKKSDLSKAITVAEEALRTTTEAVEAFAPKMEINLDIPEAVLGQTSEGTLTVTNVGKALAKDLKIKILGDVEVEKIEDIPTLRAKGEVKIALKLKMTSSGSIPLAIHTVSHRVLDGKEYVQEIIAQVEVVEKSEPSKPLIAEKESRCLVCKGSIKVGFRILKCANCGKEFHEMCGTRAEKCPSCGKAIPGIERKK